MRDRRNLVPSKGERGLLVGKTGSGKSTTARVLASQFTLSWPGIVLDTKPTAVWRGWGLIGRTPDEALELLDAGYRRVVYRPAYEDKTPEALDYFLHLCFEWAKDNGPLLVILDEVTHVSAGAYPTRGVSECLGEGREYGLTMLNCTQRPAFINGKFYTETERFYVHRLRAPKDRQRINEHLGYDLPMAERYRFWYYDESREEAPLDWHFEIRGWAPQAA